MEDVNESYDCGCKKFDKEKTTSTSNLIEFDIQLNKEVPETMIEAFDKITNEMRETFISKQKDYGPQNISQLNPPIKGIFVRVFDKVNRLKRLVWEEKEVSVKDETILDTWGDLSVYGIIAIMVSNGWWGLPLGEEEEDDTE